MYCGLRYSLIISFLFVAFRPSAGHSLLILEVSRSHTTTHHSRYDSSGRVISSSQRPLPGNTHNRQTSMPLVGFELTILAGERPQTYAIDRAATSFFYNAVFQTCDKCKGNMLKNGRLVVCSGWRWRLKHWTYSRNYTGSIPDHNKRFFYTWNFYWFNSACTNEDYLLLFSRSNDCA
jgi:hypothetical protein